jgi:hypothetical protein
MALEPEAIIDFMSRTTSAAARSWDVAALQHLATAQVPRDILGAHAWLTEADIRLTWASWFVDGLVDRRPFIHSNRLGYAHLYSEVQSRMRLLAPTLPIDELRRAAAAVTDFAWDDIDARRGRGRGAVTPQMRADLWFAAEPTPRCYLCGYEFSDHARDRLLGRSTAGQPEPSNLPLLVDFTRPRGLVPRDLMIEIDHVAPVANGGKTILDNLRLSCGWCNRVKAANTSLYTAPSGYSGEITSRELGIVTVPQPLWVLRLVATRGRCEEPSGCSAVLATSELFLAPRNPQGTITPTNAMVTCSNHDPWATARFVSRAKLSRR